VPFLNVMAGVQVRGGIWHMDISPGQSRVAAVAGTPTIPEPHRQIAQRVGREPSAGRRQ
jgi:hypothetical protein